MPKREDIIHWLRRRVAEEVNEVEDNIRDDLPFAELGVSSRDAVSLVGELADWLEIRLDATVMFRFPTIERLAEHAAQVRRSDAP